MLFERMELIAVHSFLKLGILHADLKIKTVTLPNNIII